MNVLHTFASYPHDDDGLVPGPDGNYYGILRFGGGYNAGSFYQLSPGGTYTVLYEWNGWDGGEPTSLILGSDGDFYGTTALGGAYDLGTVFRLSTGGAFSVLAEFSGGWEGRNPDHLIEDGYGDFYATTEGGGPDDEGRVVILVPGFDGTNYTWSIYGMANLSQSTTGVGPTDLLLGSDGNLYGTTSTGGQYGGGTLYRITTASALPSVLHDFGQQYTEGISPVSIVEVANGKLIGFTSSGGYSYLGVVFAYDSSSGVSVVLHLDASTGYSATSAPILGNDGHLYGTMSYGGAYNGGTVYRLDFDFSTYTFDLNALYDFSTGSIGYSPAAPLVETGSGSFLGITRYSSSSVFEFTP